jgi:hypothetical protein
LDVVDKTVVGVPVQVRGRDRFWVMGTIMRWVAGGSRPGDDLVGAEGVSGPVAPMSVVVTDYIHRGFRYAC